VQDLEHKRAVECIAAASGPLGTCAEYLFDTVAHLEELSVKDRGLERMRRSWRCTSRRGSRGPNSR
jgi:cation transport protein ChaC